MVDQSVPIEDVVKKRIARYDHYYDARTHSYALRKTSKPKTPKPRKYALVVRRVIDERGRHVSDVIDIKSTQLRDVLLAINEGVEGLHLRRSEPRASPKAMFHSYPGLRDRLLSEEKKDPQDEDLIADIKAAIQTVEDDQGTALRDLEKLTSQQQITYDLLWALFKPNFLVYSHDVWTEQDRLLLVRSVEYRKRPDETKYLELNCDVVRDDGRAFGLALQQLEINEFQGTCPITDLDAYPLEYRVDKHSVYARALELGKTYVQMDPHSYRETSGQAMREVQLPDGRMRNEKFYASGRVMISPLAFRQFSPNTKYNFSVRRAIPRDSLTDDQYALCTPILLGFSFERKLWGAFAMSRLQSISWNDDAFRSLVLGNTQKELIHSLVREHAANPDRFDDVVKGKGRGLIGLLAGPPGCGKTLTAEAVAETTRKPLYTVSAGELGTTTEDVEQRLVRALELAQIWGAVLLLDEADVFLQQRSVVDMQRNALVSIFLRQLEYYQGILILTTNMPERCDAAFESRIHFSVNYPKLDVAARKSVWSTFFSRASINTEEADLDRLASRDINGRQIKNVFSSAMTISRSKGLSTIAIQNVDVVLNVLNDWQTATHRSLPEVTGTPGGRS